MALEVNPTSPDRDLRGLSSSPEDIRLLDHGHNATDLSHRALVDVFERLGRLESESLRFGAGIATRAAKVRFWKYKGCRRQNAVCLRGGPSAPRSGRTDVRNTGKGGLESIRDKTALPHSELISAFMKRLSQADVVD